MLTRVKGRTILCTSSDKQTQVKSENKTFTVHLSTIITICSMYTISAKIGSIEISGLSTKEKELRSMKKVIGKIYFSS